MFCKACGNELFGDEMYCEACGAPVNDGAKRTAGRPTSGGSHQDRVAAVAPVVSAQGGNAYQSFEYARTTVGSDLAQAALDCYESLGYELTGQRKSGAGSQITLSFRRSRKVRNKAQLSKIQRTMDDTLASIANMEAEKTKKATTQAIILGIISALILGVGMCCTMEWTQFMVPGIIIGLIGIGGCVLAYLRYLKVRKAETARLDPKIEEAYDRLAVQCEEAQAVLRAS